MISKEDRDVLIVSNAKRPFKVVTARDDVLAKLDEIVELASAFHEEARGPVCSFHDAVLRETITVGLDSHSCFPMCILDTETDKVVGFIFGYEYNPIYSLDKIAAEQGLFVAKEYRGQNVGTMLIRRLISWAKDRGCKYAMLGATSGICNEAAGKAFEGAGFRRNGMIYAMKLKDR